MLCPYFEKILNKFEIEVASNGLRIRRLNGFRSFEDQAKLYAIGRTIQTDKKIVTKAKAGFSWHNYGLAQDYVFVDNKGKPDWSIKLPWDELGDIGKKLGMVWGGNFKGFYDAGHFEYHNGVSIRTAYKIHENGTISDVWGEVQRRKNEKDR